MIYYIYKIENVQNGKIYIGLTDNLSRRRNRHFSDLKFNRHDNSFLQKEYNIYGKDNFSFEKIFEGECTYEEISKKEEEFIAFYDSYRNGYNQNKGGNFGPSNGGTHLTYSDIYTICSVLEFYPTKPGEILAQMFGVTRTTINRIKQKINHINAIEEYEKMSLEDRQEIYNIFIDSSDFVGKKVKAAIIPGKRKLTKEQVFLIFANEEFKITTKARLCKDFNITDNTIRTILNQQSYKDYKFEYDKLTLDQKLQLAALLRN